MILHASFPFIWFVIFVNREVLGSFVCPVKYTRVGCFKDSMEEPRPLPQLLMTDRDATSRVYSGKSIHWGYWDAYLPDLICRCAAKAKAKGHNVFGLQHYGECWSGCGSENTYSRDGNASTCITYDFRSCGPQDKDCVGKRETNFVYTLNGLHSKLAAKLNSLTFCQENTGVDELTESQNYLVAIRTSSACAATSQTMPSTMHAHSLLTKVQNIYKGHSCIKCLKTVNESSSMVLISLQFTCQGQHLKKLVAGLGANNIIKAVCSTPPCTGSMYPCSYPCGTSSCSISPSLPYPSICPVPGHYPEQVLPPQCPMSCPSVCAPACTPFCCRSLIGRQTTAEQFRGPLSTNRAGNFNDDEVIEDNVL